MILQCMERRKELQKSIKSEHFNASCANGHCNSASEKVVKHKDECSARWIFQKWQPQPLEDLKFVKSWKLSENWNLNPFSEIKFLKVYKHMFFRSEFAHKLLIYALIITFYFPLIYALIIRGGVLAPPLLICPGIMLVFSLRTWFFSAWKQIIEKLYEIWMI